MKKKSTIEEENAALNRFAQRFIGGQPAPKKPARKKIVDHTPDAEQLREREEALAEIAAKRAAHPTQGD